MKKGPQTLLRCCHMCNQVWEFDRTQGRELYYPHFPTLGLQRETCSKCKEVAPKKYVSSDDQTLPDY